MRFLHYGLSQCKIKTDIISLLLAGLRDTHCLLRGLHVIEVMQHSTCYLCNCLVYTHGHSKLTHFRLLQSKIYYIIYHGVYNSILRSMDYLGTCLESVGVTVPYVKVRIVCIICILMTIATHLYNAYIHYRIVIALIHKEKLLVDVYTTYGSLVKNNSFYVFTILLFLQYLYVLFKLYYSVWCVRNAVEGVERIEAIRSAWTTDTYDLQRSNLLEVMQRRFEKIHLMSTCVSNSVRAVEHFYKHLTCFQLIAAIFVAKHNILMAATGISYSYIPHMTLSLIALEVVPILLRTKIRFEFKNIISLLRSCYHTVKLHPLKGDIKRCIQKYLYTNIKFDSRFFKMDFALIALIFDFVSLFAFAILT